MDQPPPLPPFQLPVVIPPADAPPPDLEAMGQALHTLGDQFPRVARVDVSAQLQAIAQSVNLLVNNGNRLTEDLGVFRDDMHRRLDSVEQSIKLISARTVNAAIHSDSDAPIMYPAPFVAAPDNPLPVTRSDLGRISGIGAANALQHLGYHPIPEHANERVRALHIYLGVKIR